MGLWEDNFLDQPFSSKFSILFQYAKHSNMSVQVALHKEDLLDMFRVAFFESKLWRGEIPHLDSTDLSSTTSFLGNETKTL